MPKFTLMPHQEEGVKFLETVDGIGALLYDPGVGKTGTAMTWLDNLAARKGEVRVLVVSPLTAADTWVSQVPDFMDSTVKARMLTGSTLKIMDDLRKARNWTTVPNAKIAENHRGDRRKVTIMSMSAGAVSSYCTNRAKIITMLQAIRAYKPDVVICDESHIIKSATANISKAMYQIGQLADHRIILTGTVNPHSPLDCYGQWLFLAPWTFSDAYGEPYTQNPLTMTTTQKASIRPWPWGRFKMRYGVSGGYMNHQIVGYQNLQDLNDRVAERAHVVTDDVLNLKKPRDIPVHVTLNAKERKAYNDMRDQLLAELDSGALIEAPNALAKMMKLRQIASGFVKDTETGDIHVVGTSLQKAVTEIATVQLVGENRLVVFAYFRAECAALVEALRKIEKAAGRDTVVEVITGETKKMERIAIRRRFRDVSGNPQRTILVAQQRTMSVSVNELITARHAIYASMSERRDDWAQSRKRLHRKGQMRKVCFWNVFVPGSVGEVMLESHRTRGDMEKALLDHIKWTPRL